MPKVTITFSLPDEEVEHKMAINGGKYFNALWDITQHMRGLDKWGHAYSNIEEAISHIRQELLDIISTAGVSLDD